MKSERIDDEKIITLNKINDLIDNLDFLYEQDKATDNTINQLLYAYEIKIKILNNF